MPAIDSRLPVVIIAAVIVPSRILSDIEQRRSGRHVAAVIGEVDLDPLEFVRSASPAFASAWFLATPDGFTIGAVGTAWQATAGGIGRLDLLDEAVAGAGLDPDLRALVGFSFADGGPTAQAWEGFPAALAVIPEAAVISDESGTRLVAAVTPERDSSRLADTLRRLKPAPSRLLPDAADHVIEARPSPETWKESVAETATMIRSGALDKVVLARSVAVRAPSHVPPFDVVAGLRERYGQCYVFGVQRGGTTFVGASPELLIGRRGSHVRAVPLAGSAPRGEGANDVRLGQRLLDSDKDQKEHRFVVDHVAARLGEVVDDLRVPAPTLRRYRTVQHLATHIEGVLAEPISVLGLAARLHPTPAVAGTPISDALGVIDKFEVLDRGWYSGGIGWATPGGDGDIAVALRCGLLHGGDALLYAGNGIVAASDPQAELEETRIKFRPLLDLIAAT